MTPFPGSQAIDSCGDRSNVRVSALLAVALALASCTGRPASAPPPPKVKVVQPVAREITEWDEYTARLEAVDSVEVRPRVSGYLQSIHFQDGAIVKKGDLLFSIDPRPYEAALRRAEADRRAREAAARARAEELRAARGPAREPRHLAGGGRHPRVGPAAGRGVARRRRRRRSTPRELDVEFTHVTAPVSGRVGRKLVTEGNLINGGTGTQGTLLTTIVSLDPIYAYFEADERVVSQVRPPRAHGSSGRARATTRIPCTSGSPTRRASRTKASWTSSTTSSTAAPARSSGAPSCRIPT